MIDLRIWRTALLAAPVALVVAMFSLQQPPEPIESTLTPDDFDSDAAGVLTRDMIEQFADPRPGSEADAGMAQFVQDRFEAIPSAEVAEQTFEASFDGEDVDLRNLLLTLPGSSERQVAVIAHRDVAEGSGATTSIPSTAILLQIAAGFSGTTHEKSLVFVSTDGGGVGALGARRFLSDYSERSLLDAAIVVSQPASPDPQAPFVIPWSAGDQSTSAALTETANATLSNETGRPAGDPGPLTELMRLAVPTGLGEQGPLIESGLDAVRISSTGELPPPPERDTAEELDGQTVGDFGRSALSLVLALDTAPTPVEHGPDAYVGVAGNLLPGWALAMLALALLAPVALASFVAVADAARSPWQAGRAVGWAALRAVPFGLALLTLYMLAFTGVIPSPEFPFDPQTAGLGTKGTIGVVLTLAVLGAAAFLLRPLLAPPASLARVAAAAALGLAAACAIALWFINPYLTLLVAIGLQAWVPVAAGVAPGRLAAAGLVALGALPLLAAVADVAGRFDAGLGVVWDLLLLFTSGQTPDSQVLLACLIAGCGLALVAAAGDPADEDAEQLKLGALVERGRRLEERRAESKRKKERRRSRKERPRPRPAPPPAESPEPYAPETNEPDHDESAQSRTLETRPTSRPPDQPERDPRMWSKPRGSTSLPSASRIDTPSPWTTRPT